MDDTGSGSRTNLISTRTPRGIQNRALQLVLIASTIEFSWLGMMVVHEFGHVLFAWASGGVVARVVLGPLIRTA